jgi:hypothetical protein
MSTLSSYDRLVTGCQRLVVRAADHAEELPHVGEFAAELESVVTELRAIKERQQHHKWGWHQASKELQQAMATARFVVGRLRDYVKCVWGRYDPRLVEFGVKPRRRNRREEGAAAQKANGSEHPM